MRTCLSAYHGGGGSILRALKMNDPMHNRKVTGFFCFFYLNGVISEIPDATPPCPPLPIARKMLCLLHGGNL